jgi:predicted amidophosphoribosyltransferase
MSRPRLYDDKDFTASPPKKHSCPVCEFETPVRSGDFLCWRCGKRIYFPLAPDPPSNLAELFPAGENTERDANSRICVMCGAELTGYQTKYCGLCGKKKDNERKKTYAFGVEIKKKILTLYRQGWKPDEIARHHRMSKRAVEEFIEARRKSSCTASKCVV